MAPMIDIVFQLITFFIFALNSEKVALSEQIQPPLITEGQGDPATGPKDLILEITKEGSFILEGKPLSQAKSKEETRKILMEQLNSIKKEDRLVIRADQEASFELIKPALETANKAGLSQVSLRVRRPEP